MRFSKRTIDALVAVTRKFYFDSELRGFGVRVEPTGAKYFIVQYRPGAGGRNSIKRRLVIGKLGTLTPDEAREEASRILATVRLGGYPAAIRRRERATPTFREFVARYLEEEASPKLKPRTVVNYRIYLEKHACRAIGSLKVNAVSEAEIARLHRQIGQTKPVTANRVVETITSVYRYAAITGEVSKGMNPTSGVRAFREHGRERFLTTTELVRLGESLRIAETVGIPWQIDSSKPAELAKHRPQETNRLEIVSHHAVAAIRLLLFTGCRLREILNARWSDVDWDRGMLRLSDSKTGPRLIVLSAPALEVLHALTRTGTYVIAGNSKDRPRPDLKRPWDRITAHAGLAGLRLHDLRHSFASVGAGGGMGLPIIGKLLGHSSPATTARHAHLDNDPLRRASNAIAGRIAAALNGDPSAEVLPLARAAAEF